MHLCKWDYVEFDGLPPEGERGQFLGFDRDRRAYILRWGLRSGCWFATTLEMSLMDELIAPRPCMFFLRNEHADMIVSWAALPLQWSEIERRQCERFDALTRRDVPSDAMGDYSGAGIDPHPDDVERKP